LINLKSGQDTLKHAGYALVAVVFLLVPVLFPIYAVTLVTEIFIYSIFAMSLNLLVGYMGYTSLGHATFFAAGGYATALIITKMGFQSFIFCVGTSLVIGAIVSAIFGLIAMRVSGIYFLMITLAIGQMFWAGAWSWRSLTGGDDGLGGITRPHLVLFGHKWSFVNESNFYYLILFFTMLSLYSLYRIVNSPFGKSLKGIRTKESRMRALGYNTWRYKYICYVIAGIFAALAGSLKIYQDCFISTSYASIELSGLILLMVIVGGSHYFLGPVVGTFIIQTIANIMSSYTEYWYTIMGVALIISVTFFPQGVTGYVLDKIKFKGSGQ
jgi:branched-chain amino acid transport system permease protein